MIVSLLSGSEFESNANFMLVEFVGGMKQFWLILVSLLRTLLTASGMESDMSFQSIDINGKALLQRYSPAPSAYNACACSVARNCPDPAWSGGQFLCDYGNNCTAGTVVWSIPGLIRQCTVLDSMLGSDLRCFFDQTCLDILLSMYNIDMPERLPLPSATLNITALDSSTLLSFLPTDTIGTIVDQLMIDEWTMLTNFVGYYNACNPASCTYTFTRKMDLFYVFTMISTFFGGLVVTFRLLVPICVLFVHWILTGHQGSHSNINDQRSTQRSCGKCICLLGRKI
jgi:hypothetical protein